MASSQLLQRHKSLASPARSPQAHAALLRPVVSRHAPFTAATWNNAPATRISDRLWGRRAELSRLVLVRAEQLDDGRTPGHPYPWEEDFDLLSDKVKEVTDELTKDLRGCNIWLIGMMGSGKSTVGKMLSNTLKYAFFDTDSVIELAHDKKPVSQIFAEEGQEYFRNCESQIIKELSPYRNLVIATGGGAVLRPENWGYMHLGIVCWLNGDVDLLARRVVRDGLEKRPLLAAASAADGGGAEGGGALGVARDKLAALQEQRRRYYENADVVVTLEGYGKDAEAGAPTAAVMYRLLSAINEKVQAKKREQAQRMNFTIEGAEQLKNMRTMESPAAAAAAAAAAQGEGEGPAPTA
ncbi:hypothetical protein VOLCADRAFT_86714 [Volvox carteri f. nagariensis]|uniref:shikimate kinase n=1 Tax=Volvox carteri f. nagariensis TaxID=3068 RepID=D8TJE7_VOLCA|nr:uncharacterized protein VOLCADRAFT_86714 [Volvox carteri f. nagariensis]EFJ52530.1 hypothetical protein VOLCADRAFT_86714 [Volvox carteri f. nagariensis]|eukprot:XP_002946603.1 hypothetical protein VOLCADRAFT_86714 [Volvox carteri f. nagariensis]